MFNDVVTIYHHNVAAGRDEYIKQTLAGFYWCEKCHRVVDGKSVNLDKEIKAISDEKLAGEFGASWSVETGDLIIKGRGDDINSRRELKSFYTVTGVEPNICHSDVDNVVIIAK